MMDSSRNYLSIAFSLLFSVVFLLLFAFNVNPYWINSGGDSAIYQLMGQAILNGKTPYLDIFDHKGFLLYCIQALGIWLHPGHLGLFFLSVLNLSICFFVWYKTANLILDKYSSYIPALLSLALYAPLVGKGNDTEFWSLPYIACAYLIICKYHVRNILIDNFHSIVIGLFIGVLAFIRANNAAPIIAICICFAIDYIVNKRYARLLISFAYVVLGVLIVFVITSFLFVLLYGYNNLYYLYFGTFIFNLAYASDHGTGSLLQYPFYLSIIICLLVFLSTYKKGLKEMLFITFNFLFVYLSFGKAYYLHYYSITIPIYTVAFVLVLNSVWYKRIPYKKMFIVFVLIVGCICSIIIWPSIQKRFERGYIMEDGLKKIQANLQELPKNELDSIWNYNAGMTGANIMLTVGAVQMNRIVLPMQLDLTDELQEIGTIREIKPLWIMMAENTIWSANNKMDSVFINENYLLKITTDMKTDSLSNILLFRKRSSL